MKPADPSLVDELLGLVNEQYRNWQGFEDSRFLADERAYKEEAAGLAAELLASGPLKELLSAEGHAEVVERVRRVAQATNMLYLATPLTGDLEVLERDSLTVEQRANLIFELLHGMGPTAERLDEYRRQLESAGLRASWPLPTYLLFLLAPQEEVFVKPSVIRWLAHQTRGLVYQPGVNSDTYQVILDLHREIREALTDRGYQPRDMIDIQSFLWVAFTRREESEFSSDGDDAGRHIEERLTDPASAEIRVPMHHDDPALIDELGRRPFAKLLAQRIRQIAKSATGSANPKSFAVHLHGPWGSGKTSILNFLGDELRKGNTHWIIVDFNAWKYQRIRPPWWPLIREVFEQAMGQLPPEAQRRPQRIWQGWRLRTSWLPVGLTLLTIGLMILFVAFLAGAGGGEGGFNLKEAVTLILAIITLGGTIFTLHRSLLLGSAKAAQAYMELKSDPFGPLSRLFERLIGSFGRPVAIFVDDLDRCDEEYVVDLLEGVQTLFRQAPAVYVVAADREWLRTSFEHRYQSFLLNVGEPGRPLGHLFLEKVFQISIAVPRLSPKARLEYWQRLIASAEARSSEEAQDLMVERGAALLGDASSPNDIQRVVDQHKGEVDELGLRMAAAERLSSPQAVAETEHFLAPYEHLLEPNPRSMKRLVNAFGLQYAVNLLSHVDVPLEALALWTIMEQRWPTLADLLIAHPDLINNFEKGDSFETSERWVDRRVPESLRGLFGQPAVLRIIAAEGAKHGLDVHLLRRLVGEAPLVADSESADEFVAE